MGVTTLSPLEELEDGFGGGIGPAASHTPLPPHSAPAGELRGGGHAPTGAPKPIVPSWERGEISTSPPAESCVEELEELCVCCLGEEQDQPCEWASHLFITLPLRASLFNFWSSAAPASVAV